MFAIVLALLMLLSACSSAPPTGPEAAKALIDEAAAAMVPGPVATTALATLVLGESQAGLLAALASGERTAGVAFSADLRYDAGRVSGTAEYVLGADAAGVLLLPADDQGLMV